MSFLPKSIQKIFSLIPIHSISLLRISLWNQDDYLSFPLSFLAIVSCLDFLFFQAQLIRSRMTDLSEGQFISFINNDRKADY